MLRLRSRGCANGRPGLVGAAHAGEVVGVQAQDEGWRIDDEHKRI
jgi:hypothetical protein